MNDVLLRERCDTILSVAVSENMKIYMQNKLTSVFVALRRHRCVFMFVGQRVLFPNQNFFFHISSINPHLAHARTAYVQNMIDPKIVQIPPRIYL